MTRTPTPRIRTPPHPARPGARVRARMGAPAVAPRALPARPSPSQLEGDHFGMEKVKTRILEYLSVAKLKGDHKGSILCMLGPPGIGKTSLGRSIADALHRDFYRVSLGGVHSEAEVRAVACRVGKTTRPGAARARLRRSAAAIRAKGTRGGVGVGVETAGLAGRAPRPPRGHAHQLPSRACPRHSILPPNAVLAPGAWPPPHLRRCDARSDPASHQEVRLQQRRHHAR